jgi:hypothetical protein
MTCDIRRIRAPAARRVAHVRIDDDNDNDNDDDGVRDDDRDDDVVQCGMRHAPIKRLVDEMEEEERGLKGGGAGTTGRAEGKRHGRMSVVRVNPQIGYRRSGGGEGEEEDGVCVGVGGGDGIGDGVGDECDGPERLYSDDDVFVVLQNQRGGCTDKDPTQQSN